MPPVVTETTPFWAAAATTTCRAVPMMTSFSAAMAATGPILYMPAPAMTPFTAKLGPTLCTPGGTDTLYGGSGADALVSGAGIGYLDGGADNDWYYHGNQNGAYFYEGGGTTDVVKITNATYQTINLYQNGNDLVITTDADEADGYIDTPIIVVGPFLGGTSHIEYVLDQNNQGWAL